MLVSLIPFFLVARLAVDETVWSHGPEFVFDLEMNVTSVPMNHDDVQKMKYTFAKLYCRTKGPSSLVCQLGNVRSQNLDMTNNNEIDTPENERKAEITEKPFQIIFNEKGVEHLVVDKETFTRHLNTIKNIASLLSIGADLNGKSDGRFEAPENSTVGLCNVTFDISHQPVRSIVRKMRTERYELESLPNLNKVPGETIDIRKTTDLNDCSFYASFYHGTYGDNVVDTELTSHLKSSVTHMFITDSRFIAELIRNASLGHSPYDYAITEKMMLSLQGIRAASGPVPGIPRASRTTITANSKVDRINDMQ